MHNFTDILFNFLYAQAYVNKLGFCWEGHKLLWNNNAYEIDKLFYFTTRNNMYDNKNG